MLRAMPSTPAAAAASDLRASAAFARRCRAGRALPSVATLAIVAAVAAGAMGCGGASPQANEPALALTDRDPPPFTPTPSDYTETGGVTAGRVSGNIDQARRVALEVFEAVRAADAAALRAMLSQRVVSPGVDGFRRTRTREIVISQIVRAHRRTTQPRPAADQMLQLQQIDVRPVRSRNGALGSGVRPTDLMVTIPQTQDGRQQLPRWYNPWRGVVRVIVRPGQRAQVIGL